MSSSRSKVNQTPSLGEGRGGLIVVLGAGESGVGAAVLAKKKEFDVFVSDSGSIKDKYKKVLSLNGIAFEEGKHSANLILTASEVVKSPGIPYKSKMVQAIIKKKIPVISEIEFAARYTNARLIGITGTNGKTTTTSLVYHILKKAGYKVRMAGNIGESFAKMVAEETAPLLPIPIGISPKGRERRVLRGVPSGKVLPDLLGEDSRLLRRHEVLLSESPYGPDGQGRG